MNKNRYNYIFLIIMLIIAVILIGLITTKQMVIEPFTPALKRLYRPPIRNARNYVNKTLDTIKNKLNVFFRKIGLY